MKIHDRTTLILCLALALGACGGGSDEAEADAGPRNNSVTAVASSGPPAGSVRGTASDQRLDCAAINARRGEGPDIVGVTVGMPAEQAFQKIACSDPALYVNYSETDGDFTLPALPDGRRPRVRISTNGGQEGTVFRVGLLGQPGQERVIAAMRRLSFRRENAPAVTALVAQLEAKYGTLVRSPANRDSYVAGAVRSADGRAITTADDPIFLRCLLDSPALAGECGLSVVVSIFPRSDNRELVDWFDVAIVHGSYARQQVEAFAAQARDADQQRRSRETEAAAGRAPAL